MCMKWPFAYSLTALLSVTSLWGDLFCDGADQGDDAEKLKISTSPLSSRTNRSFAATN